MIGILKIAFIAYIAIAIYGQGIKDGKRECNRHQEAPATEKLKS